MLIGMAPLALQSSLFSQIIISHIGDNDPTSEGFTQAQSPSGGSVGALSPDPGFENAWDITTVNGDRPQYTYTLDSGENADVNSSGWRFSVRVRVDGGPTSFNNARLAEFSTDNGANSANFRMRFATDGSGFTTVELLGSGTTVSGGSLGYHTFELVSDDGITADLYVNGIVSSVTDFAGSATGAGSGRIRFGAITTADVGSANFAEISLVTIPEPSAFAAICGVALLGMIVRVRFMKRRAHSMEG